MKCILIPAIVVTSTNPSPQGENYFIAIFFQKYFTQSKDKNQRRRSGSCVRSGSGKMGCSKIHGPSTWFYFIFRHVTVTRASYSTCTGSHLTSGRSTWPETVLLTRCVAPVCRGAPTLTQPLLNGSMPVLMRDVAQINLFSSLCHVKLATSRCVRSSRALCTSPRARCRVWRLLVRRDWCPSHRWSLSHCPWLIRWCIVRVGATTVCVTPTTPAWRSWRHLSVTSVPCRSLPVPSLLTPVETRSGRCWQAFSPTRTLWSMETQGTTCEYDFVTIWV